MTEGTFHGVTVDPYWELHEWCWALGGAREGRSRDTVATIDLSTREIRIMLPGAHRVVSRYHAGSVREGFALAVESLRELGAEIPTFLAGCAAHTTDFSVVPVDVDGQKLLEVWRKRDGMVMAVQRRPGPKYRALLAAPPHKNARYTRLQDHKDVTVAGAAAIVGAERYYKGTGSTGHIPTWCLSAVTRWVQSIEHAVTWEPSAEMRARVEPKTRR